MMKLHTKAIMAYNGSESDRRVIGTYADKAVVETEMGTRELWQLGSGQRKHFHLLIDERMFEFVRNIPSPVKLIQLTA